MLDQIKRIAAQTAEAGDPARFLFGEVTAADPIKIMVDNRFEIGGEALVVMREFRAGEYPTHTHTIEGHTHGLPAGETGSAQQHSHGIPAGTTEETALETAKETYFGLAAGDRVVLLRNQGGQQYLVLGRV